MHKKILLVSMLFCLPLLGYVIQDVDLQSLENAYQLTIPLSKIDYPESSIKVYGPLSESNGKYRSKYIIDFEQLKGGKWVKKKFNSFLADEFPGAIGRYFFTKHKNSVRLTLLLKDGNAGLSKKVVGKNIVLKLEKAYGSLIGHESTHANDLTKVPSSNNISDILENLSYSGPKRYIGQKISLNVKDINIDDLLRMIADTSGFNIIISDQVKKLSSQTLSFTGLPWDEALDAILESNKLVAKRKANILMVSTYQELQLEKKAELDLKKQQKIKEPLVPKLFQLNYTDYNSLKGMIANSISEDGKVSYDERTKGLLVVDNERALDLITRLIKSRDYQTPQVLIESKIVEAKENYSKEIGLQNGLSVGYDPVSAIGQANGPGFSFSSAPSAGGSFLGLGISVFRRLKNLDIRLQLMEQENKVKIVSSPKVIVRNKEKASIGTRDTTYFRKENRNADGTATFTFEPLNADLKLEVTPEVINDGSIALDLAIEKTSFGARTLASTDDPPPDSTGRTVNTKVMVENGSTVVLGGIYKIDRSTIKRGVPILQDLPGIGWLFRNANNKNIVKDELIIFLTPRIVNQEMAGFTQRKKNG